jgi:hypothetical protein
MLADWIGWGGVVKKKAETSRPEVIAQKSYCLIGHRKNYTQ